MASEIHLQLKRCHMVGLFWESRQKARREHFCDCCCNWIQPGEIYVRRVWNPQPGVLLVLREHEHPSCPLNEAEEAFQRERVVFSMPIVLEIRIREVVALQVDGKPVIRHEPEIVPVIAGEVDDDTDDSDEEILF